jgi:hypothetical protein
VDLWVLEFALELGSFNTEVSRWWRDAC